MMPRITRIILIYFFLCFYAFSDTLYLKNGSTVEGIITEEGDYYIVDLGYGTADFHKSTVGEVKYSSSIERKKMEEKRAQEKDKAAPVTPTSPKNEETLKVQKHMEIGKPGERVDITKYIVKEKITIFDFYSPYCGPCRNIAPRLENLVNRRNDIVIRKININRPTVQGIDWNSPVANQYNISYVPYFRIYNEQGNLWLEEKSASDKVYSWVE